MKKIKIIIVDDHYLIRLAVRSMVRLFTDLEVEVVDELPSAEALYEKMEQGVEVDLIILDIKMPGGDSGIDVVKRFVYEYPDVKILLLSAECDEEAVKEVITLPVGGFITKDCEPEVLQSAIQCVMQGGNYYGSEVVKTLNQCRAKQNSAKILFTPMECKILQALKLGMLSKEIASQFEISEKTVNVHKSNIFRKVGVNNVVELMNRLQDL